MPFSSSTLLAAALLIGAALSPAAAQTWTACNPMNVTTCPNDPALGTNYTWDFSQANINTVWNTTAGTIGHTSNGAEFTINKRFDSPTVQSQFYIFFGVVEVHMRGATGQGVISSIVLESDDLDEVDWEMMGGNNTHVETNYFGKGNTTLYNRAIYYPVDKPLETFHNYTTHWTAEKIEWYIDSVLVRTLNYTDAYGGYNFPQTPMTVRLGVWAGGDPGNSNGTIEWAGGLTDFSKGPYTMYVQNVTVKDYSTGSEYKYGDKSGSWQSIKTISGNSTSQQALFPTPTPTVADKWNSLSSGVKIGIYSAAGAVGASLICLISFCCIKQRRAGRREHAAYLAKVEAEKAEAEAFKLENKDPDALPDNTPTPSEYSHTNSTVGYTKSGAAGFGSASAGHYAPDAQSPAPLPAAYGMGGLKSPSAGGFDSPSHGGFPANSGLRSPTNGNFQRSNSYNNSGNGPAFPSTGGYNNASTGGFQRAQAFNGPSYNAPSYNGGYANFNSPRAYSGNQNPRGYSNNANNGYFPRQGYSNNGYMGLEDKF